MDPTELLKLLGIVIVVVGFALKLDSILIIMVAAIATAVVGGMDPVAFLDTLGESFVSNRSMCIFIMTFVLTGTLERNGLRQAAAALIRKLKNATSGIIISAYGLVRVAFAAFNINFGGVAGFIRPVIMPMAQAAVERDGNKIGEKHLEELKATSAGIDNVAWFFGQVLFVGGSGGLLVQGTLAGLGYDVSLVDLAAVQVPVAVLAMLVAIVYYNLIDRRLMRRRARVIKATGGSVYEESYNKTTEEYTWTRTVISNGEEVTLTEVDDSGISLLANGVMDEGKWYQVRYNADGEVIKVEADQTNVDLNNNVWLDYDADDVYDNWSLANDEGSDRYTNTLDNEGDVIGAANLFPMDGVDTVLYHEAFNNIAGLPTVDKARTLYEYNSRTSGIRIASDASIILDQERNNDGGDVYFGTGIDDLIDFLEDLHRYNNGSYDYELSLLIEDGRATTVIIKDNVPDGNGGNYTEDNMATNRDETFRLYGDTFADGNLVAEAEAIAYSTDTARVDYSFYVLDGEDDPIGNEKMNYSLDVYSKGDFIRRLDFTDVTAADGLIQDTFQLANINDSRLLPADTEAFVRQIYELAHRPIEPLLETGDDDFSFAVQGISRFRVSAYRQRSSLAAVVRVIRFELPDPAALHIPESVLRLADRTKGMVLVTGSAGSGKSTTLACMIDRINSQRPDHIITLEDPLEYLHSHKMSIVSQRETGSDTASYLTALRGALRQSPDVILLGEMRDYETINVAMTAAETGHLLFSSLHTVGAANTIDRILDVFPPNQQHQIAVQLAMVLQAVVSQQLLPTVDGGLLPAFEVMVVNPAIRNMIRENKIHQIDTVIAASSEEGMISMDASILNLLRAGQITERTALTYAANPELLAKKMKL